MTMSSQDQPMGTLDGTIHYPRHALLSLCRKVLLDYFHKAMDEIDDEDPDWDLVGLAMALREKIDQKAFVRDWCWGELEYTVKEIKEAGDEKSSEEYLLNPRENSQPLTMKGAVQLRKEFRRPLQGDNGWKKEDVFHDLLLFLFESRHHGNLFRAGWASRYEKED
ncbi:hypothetical protein H2248_003889 [Termitomyces sp. 'cryptogamus']|nr:hypothetical protein H2248_003889 [Termitomyces sp. 'cryptogamus']